ncbi:lysozyme inhibitor LprI family protein [Klebsiella aerogenes]|uniref:lysozyme inhibitor LprI family protein n=1 Tax=Klebsiella aerogenes TaxID=548 RepID=UPI002DDD13BC|nr:lysozyme inhibitor LprI family protein [Klebsiella aerogenes]MEC4760876.1 lysozyme inhibitor LprI family protein [Klebsiella aerogenes]
MKRTLIAAASLLASGAAWADDCSNANTQTEMNQCAAAQYQAADKKLNETWQQALKRASGQQQELLKKAQQAWISLRDADCAFLASGAEGGSMQPMLISQCMTDKSVEREAFLASLLQCEDGDQNCPLPPAN